MNDLLVRIWYGDMLPWGKRANKPTDKMLDVLEWSLRGALLTFGYDHVVLCYNRSHYSEEVVMEMTGRVNITVVRHTEHDLPPILRRSPGGYNFNWWCAGDRMNPDGWEMWFESDVILWCLPPSIKAWIGQSNKRLWAATPDGWDGPFVSYAPMSLFKAEPIIRSSTMPNLYLNTGILGLPPGERIPWELPLSGQYRISESWWAIWCAEQPERNAYIPFTEVPSMDVKPWWHGKPKNDLILNHFGGHFGGVSRPTRRDLWTRFRPVVTDYIAAREAMT